MKILKLSITTNWQSKLVTTIADERARETGSKKKGDE
jgi:hypothetical protein